MTREPIPEADRLTIPWPTVRPLGLPLTASGLKEAWEEIVPTLDAGGPQSAETRCLMAALRAVYDGMYGVIAYDDNGPIFQEDQP